MPAFLRIAFATTLIGLNTLLHTTPLLLLSLVKLALPFAGARTRISQWLTRLAESWIGLNSAMIRAFTPTKITLHGEAELDPEGCYLVLCNHRSWCDIPVLQAVFNRRIPLLRFFLKQQLIWVPVLGLAWWALDFPFMRRHSQAELARRPELRGRDLDATRAAAPSSQQCLFQLNFVEGTRFTAESTRARNRPTSTCCDRAPMVRRCDAMAGKLRVVLDLTLVYLDRPSLADLMAGRLRHIEIHMTAREVPEDLVDGGNYEVDSHYRARCQRWLNSLWSEKDALIAARLQQHGSSPSVD